MLTSPGRSRVLVYLRHVGKCGRAAGTATNGRILGRLTTVRRLLPQLLWVTGYRLPVGASLVPADQFTQATSPQFLPVHLLHHTRSCSFVMLFDRFPPRMDPNVPNRLPQDSDDEDSILVSTPTLRDLTSLRISDVTPSHIVWTFTKLRPEYMGGAWAFPKRLCRSYHGDSANQCEDSQNLLVDM